MTKTKKKVEFETLTFVFTGPVSEYDPSRFDAALAAFMKEHESWFIGSKCELVGDIETIEGFAKRIERKWKREV